MLGSRVVVEVREHRLAAGGEVRVEDRLHAAGEESARYLLESGHVRRRVSLGGNGPPPWDVVVARVLLARGEGPKRVLAVGGGASSVPGAILEEHPHAMVDVLERNQAVLDLARDHLDTAIDAEPGGSVQVRVGNLDDLLAEVRGPYDLVLVDTAALAPLGGVGGLSRSAQASLVSAVAGEGKLALGPLSAGQSLTDALGGWHVTELRRRHGEEEEVLLIGRSSDVGSWQGAIGDFVVPNGSPPDR